MRLFIAILLPKEVRDELTEVEKCMHDSVADINWVKTENRHITLKYIGETTPDKVRNIKEQLKEVVYEPFRLTLAKKIGVFPGEKHVRVIWVGVIEEERVIALHKKIEAAIRTMRDTRYHPHITLGRVKEVYDNSFLKNIEVKSLELGVDTFFLMNSTLTSQGPLYKIMAEYRAS